MYLLSFIFLAFLAGCANVSAVKVANYGSVPNGIPFYTQKPILIISSSGAKIEFIPNYNDRYALQLHTFLAKNHTKVSLNANGTLASVDANLDTTAVISLLEKALDKIPAFSTASDTLSSTGGIKVYEFVFHDDGSISLRRILSEKIASSGGGTSSGDSGKSGNSGSLKQEGAG